MPREVASDDIPRTSRTLQILLPITLPMAITDWPEKVDPHFPFWCTSVTTLRPTPSGELPRVTARRDAPQTMHSTPQKMRGSKPMGNLT